MTDATLVRLDSLQIGDTFLHDDDFRQLLQPGAPGTFRMSSLTAGFVWDTTDGGILVQKWILKFVGA